MKQKLNVIDLDRTLISYDTFRKLVLNSIVSGNLRIAGLTLIRVFRLISNETFKNRSLLLFQKLYALDYFQSFACKVQNDIDPVVLDLVSQHTDSNTINLILSASPNIYVKYICRDLGWESHGSYFNKEGGFVHLYGQGKLVFLERNYPTNRFEYNFAISDSATDTKLLSKFQEKVKWISQ